jgi:hypothetical protein
LSNDRTLDHVTEAGYGRSSAFTPDGEKRPWESLPSGLPNRLSKQFAKYETKSVNDQSQNPAKKEAVPATQEEVAEHSATQAKIAEHHEQLSQIHRDAWENVDIDVKGMNLRTAEGHTATGKYKAGAALDSVREDKAKMNDLLQAVINCHKKAA